MHPPDNWSIDRDGGEGDQSGTRTDTSAGTTVVGTGGGLPTLPPDAWPDEDDAAVVARAQADPAAFAALYVRYATRVYRYCYRRLGTREAAEDATAAVFAGAFAGLARYREGGSFAAWLFAIAHHVVVDAHRRRRPGAPLTEAESRPATEPTPEEAALAGEDRRTVRALVAELPDAQRQVLELRLAGLTGAEIAAAMGRSHLAVKMLQFRAIARLRERLGVAPSSTSTPTHAPREVADEFA